VSKRLVGSSLVAALVIGFAIVTLSSPVQAKPKCSYYCDPVTLIATVCCREWIPDNPDCRGKQCPGDYYTVCHTEPCDEIM